MAGEPDIAGGTLRIATRSTVGADLPLRVLSADEWEFWRTNGYVVVSDVVPPALCAAVGEATWAFLDADPHDPATWYEVPAHRDHAPSRRAPAGMLELYHHQSMWDVRQHPRLYDLFVDIWGLTALWVTIDRVNLNVPRRPEWDFSGFLHWDFDPTAGPAPNIVQGVVTITDTSAGTGGLQLVPEAYRRFDDFAAMQVDATYPRVPETSNCEVVEVESRVGDVVVWDIRTAHGTAQNASAQPRLAQYVSMMPAEPQSAAVLGERLASFRRRGAPASNPSARGDPRELAIGDAPQLSPLGARLLGAQPWI